MLLSPNPLGEVIIPQIHPLSCIVAIIPITTSQDDENPDFMYRQQLSQSDGAWLDAVV